MEQVSIEITKALPDPRQWVCCVDCGVLVEPLTSGTKPWTICGTCVRVYTDVKHPWLAKMVAEKMVSIDKVVQRLNKEDAKSSCYKCVRCGKHYLVHCRHRHDGNLCHWCYLRRRGADGVNRRAAARCWTCNRAIPLKSGSSCLCDKCQARIAIARHAMEYTYYVLWHARFGLSRGKKSGKNMAVIGLRQGYD